MGGFWPNPKPQPRRANRPKHAKPIAQGPKDRPLGQLVAGFWALHVFLGLRCALRVSVFGPAKTPQNTVFWPGSNRRRRRSGAKTSFPPFPLVRPGPGRTRRRLSKKRGANIFPEALWAKTGPQTTTTTHQTVETKLGPRKPLPVGENPPSCPLAGLAGSKRSPRGFLLVLRRLGAVFCRLGPREAVAPGARGCRARGGENGRFWQNPKPQPRRAKTAQTRKTNCAKAQGPPAWAAGGGVLGFACIPRVALRASGFGFWARQNPKNTVFWPGSYRRRRRSGAKTFFPPFPLVRPDPGHTGRRLSKQRGANIFPEALWAKTGPQTTTTTH